jgi:hypothetical protein
MADLDERTRANLDAVLEDACRALPHGGDHEFRKEVARKLLKSVRRGNIAPRELAIVAHTAVIDAAKRKPA